MLGIAAMSGNPPHGGEMHPDGDELIYIVSGRVALHLDAQGLEVIHELQAGEVFVIPQGTWHRIVLREPTRLLHITPGPGGEHRPLP
ncbi:MAG TPA: cupin domain-containing protein [Steroidobacteraceae bacterium]|nr:cupin domain-containing protein [Steroidobacteraceae bacterium]